MNEILIPPNSTLVFRLVVKSGNKITIFKITDVFHMETWIGNDSGYFKKITRKTKDESIIRATIRALKKEIKKDETLQVKVEFTES